MIGYDDVRNHWKILFQIHGSIWIEVLPYCIVNVILAWLVVYVHNHHMNITVSPQGHALMSLIISFLVVSKLQLAFYRYMEARSLLGQAFAACRDIHQHAVIFSQRFPETEAFRADMTSLTLKILTTMVGVIKRQSTALELVRGNCQNVQSQDPMTYVMLLRNRVYNADDVELGLLEKLRIFDMALRFVEAYRELLKLASTPLPFPMVQMGRTCLFLWVFTMPFVLIGVVANLASVCVFLFFLTYGFVGMELVSMHLLDPFGDNVNDLGVDTMTEAIIQCIGNDANITERVDKYDKHSPPQKKQPLSPYAVLEGVPHPTSSLDHGHYEPPNAYLGR